MYNTIPIFLMNLNDDSLLGSSFHCVSIVALATCSISIIPRCRPSDCHLLEARCFFFRSTCQDICLVWFSSLGVFIWASCHHHCQKQPTGYLLDKQTQVVVLWLMTYLQNSFMSIKLLEMLTLGVERDITFTYLISSGIIYLRCYWGVSWKWQYFYRLKKKVWFVVKALFFLCRTKVDKSQSRQRSVLAPHGEPWCLKVKTGLVEGCEHCR